MYIFKGKGIWIYSGQYNLYLSSTWIKNLIFCCVAPGHWDSRKIRFCAMFSKSSLFKIEYSLNIETQCLKNIQLYPKQHFHIFTRKKCPLPMLPESPLGRHQHKDLKSTELCFGPIQRHLEAFLGFLVEIKMKAYKKLTVVMCCQIVARKSSV